MPDPERERLVRAVERAERSVQRYTRRKTLLASTVLLRARIRHREARLRLLCWDMAQSLNTAVYKEKPDA